MKNLGLLFLVIGFVLWAVLSILPARASGAVRIGARKPARPAEAPRTGLDREAILWAIRQRESNDRPEAVGACGERTAYQFTAHTWRRYTDYPFLLAGTSPERAERVAGSHLMYVAWKLRERDLAREPEFIAAAWKFGPGFALACVRTDYARDVAALYEQFIERRAAR